MEKLHALKFSKNAWDAIAYGSAFLLLLQANIFVAETTFQKIAEQSILPVALTSLTSGSKASLLPYLPFSTEVAMADLRKVNPCIEVVAASFINCHGAAQCCKGRLKRICIPRLAKFCVQHLQIMYKTWRCSV